MGEKIFLPFFLHYWLFGLLLPFWKWVIGAGIILVVIFRMRFDAIKSRLSTLPTLVRWLASAIAFLGIFGTMPTSFLYGAMAGEIGANFGRIVDGLLGLPWPVFRVLTGLTAGIISVTALIAWALVLWGMVGGVIGFGLNIAYQLLRRKPGDASANPTS
jgi:hypothetical protein